MIGRGSTGFSIRRIRHGIMNNFNSDYTYAHHQSEVGSPRIRMMIVDDHEIVRKGLAMVIGLEPDIEVCCEAGSGDEAVKSIRQLSPDLVLMDYKMPGMSGLEAARAIKSILPACKVMILTGVNADSTIFEALESGIDGYILKEAPPDELIRAIHIVASGQAYLHPVVTRKVLSNLSRSLNQNYNSPAVSNSKLNPPGVIDNKDNQSGPNFDFGIPQPAAAPVEKLTEREIEVLKEVALGQNNREIAETLVVSEETVRTHLKSAFRKLGATDRTQAVVIALKHRIISI